MSIQWRNLFKIFKLLNIAAISQLISAIARTRKMMIIILSFLNQKTRKIRRRKKISDKIELEIDRVIPVPIIID